MAARLKTHLGSPTQGFAALEEGLKRLLVAMESKWAWYCTLLHQSGHQINLETELIQMSTKNTKKRLHCTCLLGAGLPSKAATTPNPAANPRLQSGLMLLDFLHALEQNMMGAYQGSSLRPPTQAAAAAFFAGNKRVRDSFLLEPHTGLAFALYTCQSNQHHSTNGAAALGREAL